MSLRLLLFAVFLAPGCGEDVIASDYTLSIVPRALDGQDPFADAPTVKLWVEEPGAEPEVTYAGVADQGIELPEQAPLPAGTRIGLIVEAGGEQGNAWDPARMQAWGWATLAEDLSVGGAQVQLDITVPEAYPIGAIGKLAANRAVMHGAAAMVPGGDVLLFGGTTDSLVAGSESDRVLRLRDNDAGSWEFESDGKLPGGALAGLTATTVEKDGEVRILVAGGCVRSSDRFQSDGCSLWGGVYDPVAEVWTVDKPRMLSEQMPDHRAVAFDNGNVLLVGRFTSLLDEYAPYVVIDAFDGRIVTEGELAGVGSLGPMVADRGNEGALVCGGAILTHPDPGTPVSPQTACYRIDLQGTAIPAAPLPDPTAYGAMVGLGNARVLLTGGIVGDLNDNEVGLAATTSWLFDGSQWQQAGDLKLGRAYHSALPMHDGGALIVGGVAQAGLWTYRPREVVNCAERYDPGTSQLKQRGCTGAGGGADIETTWWPGDGGFVLEGYDDQGTGGRSYGLVGMAPPAD